MCKIKYLIVIKMTKLVELIAIAENIPYIAPINPNIDDWTSISIYCVLG